MTEYSTPHRLDFEPGEHRYTLDGKHLPSVTQVLEPLQSFEGIPPQVLETARIFGDHVHTACHFHNEGVLDTETLDPRVGGYFAGYLNFLSDTGAVVILSEIRVASAKYGYAGGIDTVIRWLKREDVLLDIKTAHAVPKTVGPQTSAYLEALAEFTGMRLKKRFCLHLHPEHARGYKLHELNTSRVIDWNVFLSALNLWRWRKLN